MSALAQFALTHPLIAIACLWLVFAPIADRLPENRRHD